MNEIINIKRGDESAFTRVYNSYHVKLFRYFYKKTNSNDISIELVQLSLIKLWRFKHTLSELYSLDTQIFNIARTTLIDFIRQEAVKKQKLIQLTAENKVNQLVHPDQSFEITDYFNNLIETLPPTRKKVFILIRIKGLSYAEIAQYLAISVHTVEDHMSKALRHLKNISAHLFSIFL